VPSLHLRTAPPPFRDARVVSTAGSALKLRSAAELASRPPSIFIDHDL
jgi:hypothetical protein